MRMKKFVCIIIIVFCSFVETQGQCFGWQNQQIGIKDNIVIPKEVLRSKLFSKFEQIAIVQDTVTQKYGFINLTGDVVIPCIYQEVLDFYRGLAAVQHVETKKWGYINEKNEVIIPFAYDKATNFEHNIYNELPGFQGLACVNIGITDEVDRIIPDGKWGLINWDGEVILPVKYGYISPIIENMAYILDGERYDISNHWEIRGKMGFINQEGKIVIPPEYDFDYGAHFECGMVTLKKNGVEFKLNVQGEIINE